MPPHTKNVAKWLQSGPKWELVWAYSQSGLDTKWVQSYSIPMPEISIPDPIAAAARAAVEVRGISARKLARRLGMKPRTVLDFLHERRATRPSTRVSICRELGIDHEQKEEIATPSTHASAEAPTQDSTA